MKKNIYLSNFIFALVFAVLAVLVPQVGLKAVLGICSVLFFGWNMKNHKFAFVILALIFLIIPSVSFAILKSMDVSWSSLWERWGKNIFSNQNDYLVLEPDTYIDSAKNIYIDGLGLEITFDENSDQIYIPHQVRQSRISNTLTLTSDINNRHKSIIVVGTKNPYDTIQIDSTSLLLKGILKTTYFKVNTTSLTVDADIETSNFSVDSTSFQLNQELKANSVQIDATSIKINSDIYADDIEIDGTSIKWFGYIDSRNIRLDGTSLNLDMTVNGSESIDINGTSINVRIKYVDTWNGDRLLRVYGTHGDLKISEPLSNTGNIILRTEGKIKATRDKY